MLANKSAAVMDANRSTIHAGIGINSNSEKQQLAEELHKPIIRKL